MITNDQINLSLDVPSLPEKNSGNKNVLIKYLPANNDRLILILAIIIFGILLYFPLNIYLYCHLNDISGMFVCLFFCFSMKL